ncbi:MAG: hypothetical protein E5W39_09600, partial [Mesorhizobium sp.]
MRHDLHRRFVIAVKRPIPECDAWRNNETVVAELRPVVQRNGFHRRVNRRGGLMNDGDAILFCQRFITMTERFERAQPGEIEIAEETGRVALPRFNQGHFDSRGGGGEIFGDRCS